MGIKTKFKIGDVVVYTERQRKVCETYIRIGKVRGIKIDEDDNRLYYQVQYIGIFKVKKEKGKYIVSKWEKLNSGFEWLLDWQIELFDEFKKNYKREVENMKKRLDTFIDAAFKINDIEKYLNKRTQNFGHGKQKSE